MGSLRDSEVGAGLFVLCYLLGGAALVGVTGAEWVAVALVYGFIPVLGLATWLA